MYRCGLLAPEHYDQLRPLCPGPEGQWPIYLKKMRRWAERGDREIYVVYSGQNIAGKIMIAYDEFEEDQRCIFDQRVHLMNMRVLEKKRKQGYGTALLNHVLDVIYNRGYSEVTVCAGRSNKVVQHLFLKFGFNEVLVVYPDCELLLRSS